MVNDYLQRRVAEGAARASANYEDSILTSALSQALDNRLLPFCPRFKLPKVRNARQGFFTPGEFAAVLLALPSDVRAVAQFLHATGWRLNEALTITCAQVDWDGMVITISGDKTKGEDDRVFPFGISQSLKSLLQERWAARATGCLFSIGRKNRSSRSSRRGEPSVVEPESLASYLTICDAQLRVNWRNRRRNHEGLWLEDTIEVRSPQHHRRGRPRAGAREAASTANKRQTPPHHRHQSLR